MEEKKRRWAKLLAIREKMNKKAPPGRNKTGFRGNVEKKAKSFKFSV